jgi:hypothetical protein
MSVDKEVLKKLYGVNGDANAVDISVISRKDKHEKMAVWMAKWMPHLTAISIFTSIFFILLPAIIKKWALIVNESFILGYIFNSYSTFSGIAKVNICIIVLFIFFKNFANVKKIKQINIPYEDVVAMQLYPNTKKEEFFYYLNLFFEFIGVTVYLFFPFGVLAYFIRIGS